MKMFGYVWICICSEKELMKNKAQEERLVLDRRRNSILTREKVTMGADGGRFLCLTAGCGGASYLCPVFSRK